MDRELLTAALVGYKHQVTTISAKISEIEKTLRGETASKPMAVVGKKKRKMSVAARKRIAQAQKDRWKKVHDAQQKTA